ncbi:hypothetical protein DOT_1410 [Desulfosporosinus sp. OT]|nr:hypothetical protein DOT_1410 [Desulfosporosinus sp. OT]
MWSKKIVLISVISTTALLASVGIASAMPDLGLGQLTQKSGIAFSHINKKAGGAGFLGSMGSVMNILAQDLNNISTETLITDLNAGKSINDIATAQGVDKAKLAQDVQDALTANIEQAVQSGKLTEEQATTMKSKVTEQVQNLLSRTQQAKVNRGAEFGASMSSVMNVVAQDLNISTETLMSDLKAGKSINDIATAQDVDKTKLAQDVQAALAANIDQAVQAGKITEEQAATMKSKLAEQGQSLLSRTHQSHTRKNSALATTSNL